MTSTLTPTLRVLIADDHPLFRMGLRYALQLQGFDIVAEAGSGGEAVRLAKALAPEVVLLDIKMPELNGIEACRELTAREPRPLVLILTTFEEPAIVAAARAAGARAFLSKETDPAELARIIRAILAEPGRDWLPQVELPQLSPREGQVLSLLAQGYSNKSIAKALGLSPETVKDYIGGVYDKLGVSDRLGAVSRARELGLV